MELFLIFTGSFVTALSGAMAPGPLTAVTIDQSLKNGWLSGPLIILGHAILEMALLLLIVSGLLNFIIDDNLKRTISFLGGMILIFMSIKMLYDLYQTTRKSSCNKILNLNPVLSGIVISISNPHWTVWWLTIGLAYMLKAYSLGVMGIISFFSGHILADLAWFTAISYAVHKSRWLLRGKLYTAFVFICALALFLFGIWFIYG